MTRARIAQLHGLSATAELLVYYGSDMSRHRRRLYDGRSEEPN